MTTAWIYLFCAIGLEVAGTLSMKLSDGFTRPLPSLLLFVFYGLSFSLLTLSLKRIDVSIAYAIWAGMGTVLITSAGILWFDEALSTLKALSVVLVVIGVIGLNLESAGH
ncbi:DMT family transporter [Marinobacterium aestuariivivens]|uniref:DMT family transporter n=1 Tax=Marinobacterium aestuariivivens TaxID=1698799 RepID=A0ABW2A6D4_9GAMM